MTGTEFCKCGAMPAPSGRCAHCDYPDQCPQSCFRCIEYARYCEVCRKRYPTPPAAAGCAIGCRKREARSRS